MAGVAGIGRSGSGLASILGLLRVAGCVAAILLGLTLLMALKLYRQQGGSMLPGIRPGDYVLVSRWAYVRSGPERGDVVLFTPPRSSTERWAKRVVGMPGDRVGFHGDTLFLNGQPLVYENLGGYPGGVDWRGLALLTEQLPGRPHPVLERLDQAHASGQGEWVVPAGQYFVIGDNRDNSDDSRFWADAPFVSRQQLRGKVLRVGFRRMAAGARGVSIDRRSGRIFNDQATRVRG